jgi:hypothetical protein
METSKMNWTKNEFKAYILLYVANADYIVTKTEKDIICKLVSPKQYHKIYVEFDNDNDYQSIQKIQFNIKKFKYTNNQIDKLLIEIKELFLSDGNFDILEKSMFNLLKKILIA